MLSRVSSPRRADHADRELRGRRPVGLLGHPIAAVARRDAGRAGPHGARPARRRRDARGLRVGGPRRGLGGGVGSNVRRRRGLATRGARLRFRLRRGRLDGAPRGDVGRRRVRRGGRLRRTASLRRRRVRRPSRRPRRSARTSPSSCAGAWRRRPPWTRVSKACARRLGALARRRSTVPAPSACRRRRRRSCRSWRPWPRRRTGPVRRPPWERLHRLGSSAPAAVAAAVPLVRVGESAAAGVSLAASPVFALSVARRRVGGRGRRSPRPAHRRRRARVVPVGAAVVAGGRSAACVASPAVGRSPVPVAEPASRPRSVRRSPFPARRRSRRRRPLRPAPRSCRSRRTGRRRAPWRRSSASRARRRARGRGGRPRLAPARADALRAASPGAPPSTLLSAFFGFAVFFFGLSGFSAIAASVRFAQDKVHAHRAKGRMTTIRAVTSYAVVVHRAIDDQKPNS